MRSVRLRGFSQYMCRVSPIAWQAGQMLRHLRIKNLVEESLEPGWRVRFHDEIVETSLFCQGAVGGVAEGAAGHKPNLP